MNWGHAVRSAAAAMMGMARTRFALFLFAALVLPGAPGLRAADFSGSYDGIGEAAGIALTLTEAERRVVGRLTLPSGTSYALNGERAKPGEGDAQGALRVAGGEDGAFFHMEERPLGLQFLFIPARGDGTPDLAAGREYSFLKRGVRPTVPQEMERKYKTSPEEPVDLVAFIDGFRSWSPQDIARHYAGLSGKERGLLLLYDHATAELMWRLCEAGPMEGTIEAPRLAEMQDRQQIGCAAYLPMVEAAQRGGLFAEFLRRSLFQLELARATTLCDRGETPAARCADVSALASPLVLRWRRADAIMIDLARAGGAEVPVTETMAPVVDEAEPEVPEPVDAPVEEMASAPAAVKGAPLPLRRPGAGEESVSDFGPDVSTLSVETIRAHRLPLPRP